MTEPKNLDEEVAKARELAKTTEEAGRFAKESLGEAKEIIPEPGKRLHPTKRGFVSPDFVNGKFLVKAGKPVIGKGGEDIERILRRDGDVVAQFRACILVTDDKSVIKWCYDHPDICRDVEDQATKPWFLLKLAMQATSTREPQLPVGMTPDDIAPGSVVGLARNADTPGPIVSALELLKGD